MNDIFRDISLENISYSALIFRLVLAIICGAAIGIEREKRQKDAGIRTHIIVSMSCALMMEISKYGFFDVIKYDSINIDASRIAAGIISGIGFLGAGVIFVREVSIKGLTTSAGIWCTGGVGMAIGSGMWILGVSATVFMLLFQLVLHKLFNIIENTGADVFVSIKNEKNAVNNFCKELENNKIIITKCKVKKDLENNQINLFLGLKMSKTIHNDDIISIINSYSGTIEFEI